MKQSEHKVGNGMHIGSHGRGAWKATGQRAGKTLSSESHAECRLYSTTWWLSEELSLELVSGICWKSLSALYLPQYSPLKSAGSAHTSGIRLSHSSLCESGYILRPGEASPDHQSRPNLKLPGIFFFLLVQGFSV